MKSATHFDVAAFTETLEQAHQNTPCVAFFLLAAAIPNDLGNAIEVAAADVMLRFQAKRVPVDGRLLHAIGFQRKSPRNGPQAWLCLSSIRSTSFGCLDTSQAQVPNPP